MKPVETTTTEPQLERSIGLRRVMFQSIAGMAPAAVTMFGLGLVISYTGVASPSAMALGTVGALCVAYAIGQFATKIPSAGGFYSYMTATLGDAAGLVVGWIYVLVYVALMCVQGNQFALLATDSLQTYFGIGVPGWIPMVLLLLVIAAITFVGIKTSTGVTTVLGLLEVGILLVVAIALIARAGGTNSLSYFNPANSSASNGSVVTGLFLGIVFAFAALSGFESNAPLAEETVRARHDVPRAMVLATLAIGAFYTIAMYAAVVGWGPSKLSGYVASPNPWREMGNSISGVFAVLVSLAILNSLVGSTQAVFNTLTRVLFALGRSDAAPRSLAAVHRARRTPHVAIAVTLVVGLVLSLTGAAIFGYFPAFVFFLTVGTLLLVALYALICVCLPLFYWMRARKDFSWWRHGLIPLIGLSLLLPVLYYSSQGLTYPANLSIPVIVVWIVLGLLILVWLKARRVDLSVDRQRWLAAQSSPLEPADAPAVPPAVRT
jgi:amino acid transporter